MFRLASYASRERFRYPTFTVIVLIHLLALTAPYTFTWAGLVAFLVLQYVTGGIGISLCYHRLLTHSSYKTPQWMKYVLTFFACLSLQGGPIYWVSTHRLHHRESDKPLDPHSPTVSFLWAHLLWNFFDHPQLSSQKDLYAVSPDLAADPGLRFFNNFFFPIYLLSAVALFYGGYLFGGLHLGVSMVVWGVALRTVYVWHVTWLINSATHKWGYRNYNSPDTSVNTWPLAIFSFGESWHNNHHGNQRSAKFGHRWFEVDTTYWILKMMQIVGLAHSVVKPRHERVLDIAPVPVAAEPVKTLSSVR